VPAVDVLESNGDADDGDTPRRSRLRLDNVHRCRLELVRLYKDGRSGRVDTQDMARLANVLMFVVRCLEGSTLEDRIAALEATRERR
jgi:hypothetical protein